LSTLFADRHIAKDIIKQKIPKLSLDRSRKSFDNEMKQLHAEQRGAARDAAENYTAFVMSIFILYKAFHIRPL
jgi:hypothetical protein